MDRAPPKSLAIPANTPPADYKAYVEHPEVATLNQIMLHYLDMEEILKLYRQDHEQFETRQALNTLAQRFELPAATNFKQLLKRYDKKYATVRSYLYNNRGPEEILIQAAFEGNIQAFYNQLKLYRWLRDREVYIEALGRAASAGHEAIIELLFELGVKDSVGIVFRYAVIGGQLALVKKELAKGVVYIEGSIRDAAKFRLKDVLAVLLDYKKNDQLLVTAMAGAGMSGDNSIIEYVISRGGKDYPTLIESAAMCGHFSVVKEYWDKLGENHIWLNDKVLRGATKHKDLSTVKFLFKEKLVSQTQLKRSLISFKRSRKESLKDKSLASGLQELTRLDNEIAVVDSIIAYLNNHGVDVDDESSEESTTD